MQIDHTHDDVSVVLTDEEKVARNLDAIFDLHGTALAWLVAGHDFPGRTMFAWALLLPLAVPGLVMAFGYVAMTLRWPFGKGDPLEGWLGGYFAHKTCPHHQSLARIFPDATITPAAPATSSTRSMRSPRRS